MRKILNSLFEWLAALAVVLAAGGILSAAFQMMILAIWPSRGSAAQMLLTIARSFTGALALLIFSIFFLILRNIYDAYCREVEKSKKGRQP